MAQVLSCFTIPILVGSLDIDLQELKDHLLKYKDDRIDDNILASKFEDSECPYHPLVEELITSVCDVVRQTTGCGPLDCNRVWSHIHEKNMSTEWHTHQTDLAGVFYVSTPKDSGSLVFRKQIRNQLSFHQRKDSLLSFLDGLNTKLQEHIQKI